MKSTILEYKLREARLKKFQQKHGSLQKSTCWKCIHKKNCLLVWDDSNVDGFCLAGNKRRL